MNFIKLEKTCTLKYISKKTKKQTKTWKKVSVNHISDKELVTRIYKELLQLNNNPIEKWEKS